MNVFILNVYAFKKSSPLKFEICLLINKWKWSGGRIVRIVNKNTKNKLNIQVENTHLLCCLV